MDLVHNRLRDQAATDDRLVADHDHRPGKLSQAPQRGQGAREKLELRPRLDMIGAIAIDDAIAIEEYGAM